jgi:tetratricopeptide (TPR) repeat protein
MPAADRISPAPALTRRDLGAAALLAAAVGAFVAWQVLRLPPEVPQFSKYPLAALQALHGGPPPERLVDFSPLYLALHGAAVRFLADSFAGMLWLHAACIGLAASFVFLALRRVAPLPVALAGALALGLERSVVVHGFLFEPEPLLLLFVAAWLCFALSRGPGAAAGAGAALGLALLTRPSLLALAAVVPALAVLPGARTRRATLVTGLALAPVAGALLLLSLRNHQASGSWTPVVMNPGTVFFDGNNPLGPGHVAAYPPVVRDLAASFPGESDFEHAAYRLLARRDTGRGLSVAGVNAFWAGKAGRYLLDEPRAALGRLARKALFAFHAYRWNDLQGAFAVEWVLARRRVPATPLALLSALALAGVAIGLPRWRELLPAYALLAAQVAVLLASYASARQRIALLPAVCFFAALAATRVAGGWRRTLTAGAAVVLLAVALGRETGLMREHRHLYLPPPDPPSESSGDPALLDRALALFGEGRFDEAAPIFERLRQARIATLRGEPALFLGRIAARRGRPGEAVTLLEEALARAPGHPAVLAHLAALTGEPRYAARLERYLDRADARYLLGAALLEQGRTAAAAAALESLAVEVPEHEPGRALLVQALSTPAAPPAAPGPSPGAAP